MSGCYPMLCKKHLLTSDQLRQATKAEVNAVCVYARGYDYDVSGDGVTGSIDATKGSRYVDGILELDDGREVSFDGEWVGKGFVEGYDEDGNYCGIDEDGDGCDDCVDGDFNSGNDGDDSDSDGL